MRIRLRRAAAGLIATVLLTASATTATTAIAAPSSGFDNWSCKPSAALQSLYGLKVRGYAGQVGKVIALAPPTNGTTFAGLVSVGDYLGLGPLVDQVLQQFGCPAATNSSSAVQPCRS
ncbi:hypothetical protein [Kribbella sp. NBC_00359]|uniref:hypothetical protein n=1 Tax=Kribbella sp. NBC_00359 TaxID=2975966 RepID=UPI002E1D0D8F